MEYYIKTQLKEIFSVRNIISIHYFEYEKNFIFLGEKHDFWELIYIDRGSADILSDNRWISLSQGQLAFHRPNEYHNIRANDTSAPNVMILSFECFSPEMSFFSGKILTVSSEERRLLSAVIKEATKAFSSPLGDPYLQKLQRSDPALVPVGAEQLIKISIEHLLISLHRNNAIKKSRSTTVMRDRMDKNIAGDVIDYFNEHIGDRISIDMVCHYLSISPSSLKRIFKNETGQSVMAYFRHMKIDRAKLLIRENSFNITEIAQRLGYESIHHFSKQFKTVAGMSPTEYAKSIKLEVDEELETLF